MDKSTKIKAQLRRVMSDRALKIVKCSQNKVTNLKQNDLSTSSLLNASASTASSVSTSFMTSSFNNENHQPSTVIPLSLQVKINSKLNGSLINKNLSNKIVLQPIKTVDLKDKESLIEHIKTVYNDTINSEDASIVLSVQSIINSILHYIKTNQNEKQTITEILQENLFKTVYQLNMKYKEDRKSDKLRIEVQMQIFLQIENIIQQQHQTNTKTIDDDAVWEIANYIRWLNQAFHEKFKIEKFLFGEIYSNYYLSSPELLMNLMEELGYDTTNDDNNEDDDSSFVSSNNTSANNTITATSATNNSINNSDNSFEATSNTTTTTSSIHNASTMNSYNDSHSYYEEDLLNDSKRKKLVTRFPSSSLNTSRSIMVIKKRSRLKMRSPYKSPSKCSITKQLCTNSEQLRRSPRIKDRQSLKRPHTSLTITDTPIHKQHSTRITTRQQKLIKRLSFQKYKSDSVTCSTVTTTTAATTTVIPDTPEKNFNNRNENQFLIIKSTPSPKKMRFN